jgi:hypothetical protein
LDLPRLVRQVWRTIAGKSLQWLALDKLLLPDANGRESQAHHEIRRTLINCAALMLCMPPPRPLRESPITSESSRQFWEKVAGPAHANTLIEFPPLVMDKEDHDGQGGSSSANRIICVCQGRYFFTRATDVPSSATGVVPETSTGVNSASTGIICFVWRQKVGAGSV